MHGAHKTKFSDAVMLCGWE